jgi:hypothetical protein
MVDAPLLLLPCPAAAGAVAARPPCCCSSACALQPLRLDVKRLHSGTGAGRSRAACIIEVSLSLTPRTLQDTRRRCLPSLQCHGLLQESRQSCHSIALNHTGSLAGECCCRSSCYLHAPTLRFWPKTLSQMRVCCCSAAGAKHRPQLAQGCLSTS